jgi:hypothetical protein
VRRALADLREAGSIGAVEFEVADDLRCVVDLAPVAD